MALRSLSVKSRNWLFKTKWASPWSKGFVQSTIDKIHNENTRLPSLSTFLPCCVKRRGDGSWGDKGSGRGSPIKACREGVSLHEGDALAGYLGPGCGSGPAGTAQCSAVQCGSWMEVSRLVLWFQVVVLSHTSSCYTQDIFSSSHCLQWDAFILSFIPGE